MVSKIEWLARPGTAPETWNPVTGCTPISTGCKNCYAKRMARRLAGRAGYPEYPNHFDVTLHEDRLDIPLKWRKPRTVFVCSMGDLFHDDVPLIYAQEVFDVMVMAKDHTFMILTKRPGRMTKFVKSLLSWAGREILPGNIWLGVTAENEWTADKRIPILLQTPAVVRFVSCEPLLGPIDLIGSRWWDWRYQYDYYKAIYPDAGPPIDWVICGAETGPGKRYMNPSWARSIMEQCEQADIPFFFKKASDGSRLLDGQEYNQWPR